MVKCSLGLKKRTKMHQVLNSLAQVMHPGKAGKRAGLLA